MLYVTPSYVMFVKLPSCCIDCVSYVSMCALTKRKSQHITILIFSADLLVTQYCSRILVSQCKMAAPDPGRYLLQPYTTSRSFDVCEYALKSQLHNPKGRV